MIVEVYRRAVILIDQFKVSSSSTEIVMICVVKTRYLLLCCEPNLEHIVQSIKYFQGLSILFALLMGCSFSLEYSALRVRQEYITRKRGRENMDLKIVSTRTLLNHHRPGRLVRLSIEMLRCRVALAMMVTKLTFIFDLLHRVYLLHTTGFFSEEWSRLCRLNALADRPFWVLGSTFKHFWASTCKIWDLGHRACGWPPHNGGADHWRKLSVFCLPPHPEGFASTGLIW